MRRGVRLHEVTPSTGASTGLPAKIAAAASPSSALSSSSLSATVSTTWASASEYRASNCSSTVALRPMSGTTTVCTMPSASACRSSRETLVCEIRSRSAISTWRRPEWW
jgi:hypothetical protein